MKHAAAAIVLSLFVTVTVAQGEVDARSPAKKGSSAWLLHESVMAADASFRGQEITTRETVAWTLHVVVTDVDAEGNLLVTTEVARVRGKLVLAGMQGETEFDTAGEGDGAGGAVAVQAAKVLAEVAGKSFQCKVGPRGQVLELGAGKEAMIGDDARGGAMHQRSEALLRQWVECAFGIVPEKRTAGGAQWKHTAAEAFGRMPVRQQLASTLTVVDPEFFEIESTGTVDIDLAAAKELAKNDPATTIAQLEATKVTKGTYEAKQKTSRQDGFALAAVRKTMLEFTTTDPRMGEMKAEYTVTLTTSRTTEAEAKAKPKPAAADGKPAGKPGHDQGK